MDQRPGPKYKPVGKLSTGSHGHDYRALTAHKPDLMEYLLGGPKVDRFEIPRSRDKGRKAAL